MKTTMTLGLALTLGCIGTVNADDLYTVRTSDDVLRVLDTDTLTFTDIGPLGVPFDFGDLAYDATTGTMYMVQGFAGTNLYTVDLNTGAATFVGTHGFSQMFGLAHDSLNDDMFGSLSTTGTGVYDINRNTGGATLIGNPGLNLDALTYDSTRDMLVGLWAGPGSLHDVDRATGAAPTLSSGGGFVNNCGMAYVPSDDLLYVIDWSGILYQFDPQASYARTTLLTGLGAHDGLALVSDPGLTLTISNSCPGSGPATLTATGGSGGTIGFVYTLNGAGSYTIPGGFTCAGTQLGLNPPVMLGGSATGDPAVLNVNNVPGAACGNVTVQAIDAATCETSNVVVF